MALPIIRPLPEEVARIDALFREADLTPFARRGLRMVYAWATGAGICAVAAKENCSAETVRKMRLLYQQGGLDAFRKMKIGKAGRPPLSSDKAEAVAEMLLQSIERGEPLVYREVEKKTGVSRTSVMLIARRFKLDAKHRRGPVSPQARRG